MSYRVLTDASIPYVHALPGGLGADPEVPAPGSWRDVIFRLSEPFARAASQRLAYGKTDPYYSPYGGGGGSPMFYGAGSGYQSSIGGISPSMLLIAGAALLAVMMLRK